MMAPSVFQRTKSPRQSPVSHKLQSPRFLVADSSSSSSDGPALGRGGRGLRGGSATPSPPSASGPESFECLGEGDGELDNNNGEVGQRSPNGTINRHAWTRTSLRRTPPSHQENLPHRRWGSMRHSGKRQLGSNALASQLYRSSSFNSSGCGSTGDPGEDMYSDVSLEEDVQGLNYKVQLLQQQVTSLADTQSCTDDRYARAKAENAVLQARVHILEEQLRDIEVRCEERVAEEQRRCREAITRMERDRDAQVETLNARLTHAETEAGHLKQEAGRLRGVSEGLRVGADAEAQRLHEAQDAVASLTLQLQQAREAHRKEKESHEKSGALVGELQREVERGRAELAARCTAERESGSPEWGFPDLLRLEELHQDLNRLRQENKELSEAHEELQAQMLTRGLEAGRSLLGPPPQASLAAELTQMTNDQFDGFAQEHYDTQIDKMQKALKEQQEVNGQLRSYIDGILLQIVENYPQLLEVKHNKS